MSNQHNGNLLRPKPTATNPSGHTLQSNKDATSMRVRLRIGMFEAARSLCRLPEHY